jgi:hypothetical protein
VFLSPRLFLHYYYSLTQISATSVVEVFDIIIWPKNERRSRISFMEYQTAGRRQATHICVNSLTGVIFTSESKETRFGFLFSLGMNFGDATTVGG